MNETDNATENTTDNATEGIVFNIQRYSIHDGPGIRTTVFVKGCPLKCFWCQNPESQNGRPEILLDKRKCTACGQCVEICPSGAARLVEGGSTIDREVCTACGKCVEVCPNEARRLVGRRMTVDEVMAEVKRDAKFYENSGGGVTVSGGDPLSQPHFVKSIFEQCKKENFHTTLDTCGYAPWSAVESVLEYVDLVFFDIKHMDTGQHRNATGRENDLILENAKKISERKPMRIRVPMIPGFNDSVEAVTEIARFVKKELGCKDIDLLPYNKMGEVKFEFLDKGYTPHQTQDDDHMNLLESVVKKEMATSSA